MLFHGHRVIYFTATYHSCSRNGISCGFRWFTYSWDSQWRKASRKTSSLEPRCSKQVIVRTTSRRDDEIHIGPQLPQQQRCKGVAHGGNGTFEMEVLKTGTANPTKTTLLKHMFKSVFSKIFFPNHETLYFDNSFLLKKSKTGCCTSKGLKVDLKIEPKSHRQGSTVYGKRWWKFVIFHP